MPTRREQYLARPDYDDDADPKAERLDRWLAVIGIGFALAVMGAALGVLWLSARIVQGRLP